MSKLILREATEHDSHLLFKWANDKTVRENSFSQEQIKWSSHLKWFNSRIKSEKTRIFILGFNKINAGQIRFDLKEDNYWHIDYSIDIDQRGRGYGLKIVEMGIKSFPIPVKLMAKVKHLNLPSIKVFQRLKFDKEIDNEGNYVFRLEDKEL